MLDSPSGRSSLQNRPRFPHSLFIEAIAPFLEMGAYELLWKHHGTWSRLSRFLSEQYKYSEKISGLVDKEEALQCAEAAREILNKAGIGWFGVRLRCETEYGDKLRAVAGMAPCLYFQGYWNLTEMPTVAVVGTRKPSPEGIRIARKLTRRLVKAGYAIVSGLARGIDTAAHKTAMEEDGKAIAVMGTPLQNQYPKENQELRKKLAADHLVITQFPVVAGTERYFFPERNKTMSALSDATVIVEAGETSGARTQAKAALEQGRPLFILDNCFKRGLSWPEKFETEGAIRVRDCEDIQEHLSLKH